VPDKSGPVHRNSAWERIGWFFKKSFWEKRQENGPRRQAIDKKKVVTGRKETRQK